MFIKGRVHKYGDDINTDEIIPARYLNTTEPEKLGAHCLEDLDINFTKKVKKGDILVVGKNFGCGSSREHAVISIKAAGISAIVAESYARIFFRNAINTGLPVFVLNDTSEIKDGDIVEIDAKSGVIKNISKNKVYRTDPIPDFIEKIIKAGGLINYVRRKHTRIKCQIFAELSDNESLLGIGEIFNISEDGAGLESHTPFVKGQKGYLKFMLDGDLLTLPFQIIWVESRVRRKFYGIKFDENSPDRQKVAKYIKKSLQ